MVCRLSGTSCNCPDNVVNGKCDCPPRSNGNEYFSDGITCSPALPYGSICTQDYECQYVTQTTFCSGICECDPLKYYNNVSKKCENKVSFNGICNQINACNNALDLNCQTGFCRCSSNKFWNGINCTYTANYLANELVKGIPIKIDFFNL
jgi:hypothetical protein